MPLNKITPNSTIQLPDGDATFGQSLFEQHCSGCHNALQLKNAPGPSLEGIFGRPVASTEFGYSKAMRQKKFNWTLNNLNEYLKNPSQFVVGTSSTFPGLENIMERVSVIQYLKEI